MVNAFGRTYDLQISLTSGDKILFLGQPEESAGTTLRGTVDLNLLEPMKLKSISLKCVGKMKISWTTGGLGTHQHHHKEERTLLSRHLTLVEPTAPKKSETLKAGHHRWEFEIDLPGDLPQSLESDIGRVTYNLEATVERPAFAPNLAKKRSLWIVRSTLPYDQDHLYSIGIRHTCADILLYCITLPSKVYTHNQDIPVTFHITPFVSQLRVVSAMASFKEYCAYTINNHTKTKTRMVEFKFLDDPSYKTDTVEEGQSRSHVMQLKVPKRSPEISCDVENDMITIRHKVRLAVTLTDTKGRFFQLSHAVSVIIIDDLAQLRSVSHGLPLYEETWRPKSFRTTSLEEESVHDGSESGEEVLWNGIDLYRVPSYQSEQLIVPAGIQLLPLPPSYETVF